ncbi:exosome catalytic subunit dis3 [Exophiala xenobiotica]|nr:exosome catalytic subunit dis3 [Exophiala xenobiotica]KAK5230549.1 exosome catalytic subunit dis3 [Exophiala xenobiotica]KAK5248985.1 exosome catalytic subunit dis3 [Exophiala xenobiotica]KAK5347116.1 exosome catalytic subunit dis3 [Exophiala xenobiotica]KAK5363169.1 exosome catalytic subunit dis3 [Exophiala xenobiotica]
MKSLKRGLAADPSAANISSKVYIRSTRSGRVQKVVKEQYLRKDIPCSSQLCSSCASTAASNASGIVPKFILSKRPTGTKAFPNGHYLMPDTNVLLSGMDLFEESAHFHDVIVLQTVLEELKNRSLPLYNRLMSLARSEEKRFYLFFNEFRSETAIRRAEGETINDRNDRAVRKAAAWYASHLAKVAKKSLAIVILTNDQENRKKAKQEKLVALSLREYVEGLEDADRLLDMVSQGADGQEVRAAQGELFYPEYYSMSRMTTGIKAGTLHQGQFHVSPYNYLEGTVKVPAFDKPLLVLGRESSNRSISGDVVVVEVLPKGQWKAPSTQILDEEALNKNDNPEDEEQEQSVVTENERRALQEDVKRAHTAGAESRAQPTCRVVGVMKRNWRQLVGTIDGAAGTSAGNRQTTVFLVPMDKRIPKIRIRTRQVGELIGKRIVAAIDSWERDTKYPVGHYIRSLGELETKEAETEALLLEYDVQYRPFPKAVLDCLPAEGHEWKVPAEKEHPGWKGRQDLRHLLVCSIDPPGCQDIDDALHARKLPNGNFEVGVHIADVSHFVKPNNPMDAEATSRGTTVYLVDKRIDMLPMLLGTDLCSLKPYVERYAFSTLWEITPDAEVVSSSFTKSVILSKEGFSYEQAQKRIDDESATDELTQGMRALLALSQKLRQKRMDAGALNLSSPEVRIEADSESSDSLADVKTKAHLATNSLVEEFMLLANITVAKKIATVFPQTALLRRHAAPPASNFTDLSEQLKRMRGFELDVSSSRALADSLDRCVDPQHPFFNTLIRIMATRCMTSAEYFCSGSHAEPEYRHYGLASEIYTHFTSPIRRYGDLLAHRQLAYAIGYEGEGSEIVDEGLRNKGKLERVCQNLNVRHRNAQLAGRASIEYYVGQALKARAEKTPGAAIDVDGYVMRVFENGIVVFVPQFGIEGLVRLEDFQLKVTEESRRESAFDADNYRLTVFEKGREQQGVTVELFQQLKVRVSSEEKGGAREKGKRRVRIVVLSS